MKILDIESEQQLRREEAAAVLHRIADSLARHSDLEFEREGVRYTIDVPDIVHLELELEIGDEESSLEIELTW